MSTMIDGAPHLSVEAAARRLGTTPLKVLMLIKEGKLAGTCIDGGWFVTDSSVAGYVATPPAAQAASCSTGCSGCGCH